MNSISLRIAAAFLALAVLFTSACQNVPTALNAQSVGIYAQAAGATAAPFLTAQEKAQITSIRIGLQGAGSGTLTPQALLQIISTFKPTTQQGIWLSLALLAAASGYTAIYQANASNPNVAAVSAYAVSIGQGLQNAGYCLSRTEFASYEIKKIRRFGMPTHPPIR